MAGGKAEDGFLSAVMTSCKYIDSRIEKYVQIRKKMEKKELEDEKMFVGRHSYKSLHLVPQPVTLITALIITIILHVSDTDSFL